MTFATQASQYSRQVIEIFELDLDFCDNTYGSAPCTATFGGPTPTGSEECFNTWHTCQDRANYVKTERTIRFCNWNVQPPTNLECLPFLKSTSTIPTMLDVGKSVGTQATRTVKLDNPPYHDDVFSLDPYVSIRAIPSAQATFFGKLVARKKYFEGRIARHRLGFLNEDGSIDDINDPTNFRTTLYTVKKIAIEKDGSFTIQVGSVLRQADSNKLKFPLPSSRKLKADAAFSATSIQVDGKPEHFLDYLGNVSMVGEYVRIGEEIIQITSIVGDTTFNYDAEADGPFTIGETLSFSGGSTATLNALTDNGTTGTMTVQMISGSPPADDETITGGSSGAEAVVNGATSGVSDTTDPDLSVTYNIARGAGGTLATDLGSGDSVQHVYRADNKTVRDAFYDVIRAARIPLTYIDYDGQWLDEQLTWLQGYNVDTWRAHPTEIKKVLNNLIRNTPAFVFYDERAQKIKLLAVKQSILNLSYQINDEQNILIDSDSWKTDDEDRISRLYILFDKVNQAKEDDEQSNYRQWEVDIDLDAENENAYGSENINEQTVFGTWITSPTIAQLLSDRMIANYDDPPIKFTFSLDVKDSELFVGDYVEITSRKVIDEKGNPRTFFAQIIEVRETKAAHEYQYTAQELVNGAIAKVWGPPEGLPPQAPTGADIEDATTATQEELDQYMYWGDGNGLVNGGQQEGFRWI